MKEDLIYKILEAHGGMKGWNSFKKVKLTIVSGGKLFEVINQPQDGAARQLEITLQEQKLAMTPYGGPDKKTSYDANRIAVETFDGEIIAERKGSIEELHNHMKANGWDFLDRAYFNGYANWTYLATPFFFTFPDIITEEIAPWQEGNEIWKGLRITFPDYISTHSRIQDFYFGDDYLLRRHDYYIDVAGEFYAAQYVSDYVEIDGIKLPSKRRAYKRKADGFPSKDELMVHIDYSNIQFVK